LQADDGLKRSPFEKLLHWSLSFSVCAVWFFIEDGDAPHRYVGYFAFAAGGIQQVLAWCKLQKQKLSLLSDHPVLAFLTHNLIWFMLLALALSGWMMGLDHFWGEEWLERLHELFSWGLAVAVVFHLLGIIRDALKHKRATWLHMITSLDLKKPPNENQ